MKLVLKETRGNASRVLEHSEAMTTENGVSAVDAKYYDRKAKQILLRAKKNQKTSDPTPEELKASPGASQEASRALAEVIQLPLWPEPHRAAPNVVLRSALFGLLARGQKRDQLKKEELATWAGSTISFTGERLDQYDADVWLQALHYCRLQGARDFEGVIFTARTFLRDLQRSEGGNAMQRLDDSLHRMIACAVSISDGKYTYTGNLVHSVLKDEHSGRYRLVLNPEIAKLFDGGYTRLEWQVRQSLKSDLARWMQAFVLTHKATERSPQGYRLAKLRELCGSTAAVREFRRMVKETMPRLVEFGIVSSWSITENDALLFSRPSSRRLPPVAD
jgi:hypothetical protein